MAERGEYRSISRSLFSGKDFRKLPERPRWIFTVLKMNSGMVGLDTWYEAELYSRLSEESGASIDQVKLALDFLEHEGWIKREDNVLWVVGHLEHDPHLSPTNKLHRKSVQRHVAGLSHLPIVKAFVAAHQAWFPKDESKTMGLTWVWNGSRKAIDRSKRSAKKGIDTHSKHETENETENETEKKNIPAIAGSEKPESKLGILSQADCESLRLVWVKQFGAVGYPRFRKAILGAFEVPSEARPSISQVREAIIAFREWWEEQEDRDQSFWGLEKFAGTLAKWIHYGQMPITQGGVETERGKWAGSKRIRAEEKKLRAAS